MAKKNVRRGKRKTSSSWLGKLGKWTAGTLFVIACFVASHYAYDYLRDVDWKRLISIKEPPTTDWVEDKLGEAKDMAQKSIQRTEEYLAETKERVESVKQSPTLPFPEQVEIPVLQKFSQQFPGETGGVIFLFLIGIRDSGAFRGVGVDAACHEGWRRLKIEIGDCVPFGRKQPVAGRPLPGPLLTR